MSHIFLGAPILIWSVLTTWCSLILMLKCNANNSCYRVKKKKKKNHVSVCFELSCVLSFLFTILIGFHLSKKKKTFLIGFLVSINFQIYLTFSTVIWALCLKQARIALERRRFLKNAETAVQRQAMWSNLAHEMTAEFRGLCAEEVLCRLINIHGMGFWLITRRLCSCTWLCNFSYAFSWKTWT